MIDGKAVYLPMSVFPTEKDKIPKGKNGWLLILDELNSAPPAVQAAAYKIVLDRQVGQHNLHPEVYVCAAGNLETDNAIVESMSTALQSRMVHLELKLDMEDWLKWAYANNIDSRITSYVQFQPDHLHSFDPNHSDKTYACPRTWEFANRYLSNDAFNMKSSISLPLLSGTLGQGVAASFMGFCEIETPSIKEIMEKPLEVPVPTDPAVLYATSGSLASHMDESTIDTLAHYVFRMPPEFMVVTMREALRRNPELRKNRQVRNWALTHADELFD